MAFHSQSPSGQILHNSTFTGDEYVLTLDNPVEEGSYTCFLDVTDPASRCVHISPTMLFSNEVHVDNCSVQRVLGNHANQYGNEEMVLAIKLLSRQHGLLHFMLGSVRKYSTILMHQSNSVGFFGLISTNFKSEKVENHVRIIKRSSSGHTRVRAYLRNKFKK